MDALSSVLTIVLAALVIFVLLKILSAPIRLIFKLLINTAVGFALLFLVNLIGSNFGFTLEMNLVNALITGIFGIPGVIVLILIKLFL
jgi:inhibitor of the pro-sigma K processing machinery